MKFTWRMSIFFVISFFDNNQSPIYIFNGFLMDYYIWRIRKTKWNVDSQKYFLFEANTFNLCEKKTINSSKKNWLSRNFSNTYDLHLRNVLFPPDIIFILRLKCWYQVIWVHYNMYDWIQEAREHWMAARKEFCCIPC